MSSNQEYNMPFTSSSGFVNQSDFVNSSDSYSKGDETAKTAVSARGISDLYHAVDDFVDKEIEEAAKASREFRRNWVPAIKSTLSSLADVIGDWVFYYRTKNGDDGLDVFEQPIYTFCIISSVLSALAILSIIMNNCACFKGKNESVFKKNCLRRINWIMGFEIFLEDIPQVVLTTLVLYTKRGGVWTPVAVFNVTTSAFNFTFNVLDMLMPLPEKHIEGALEAEKQE